MRHGHPTFSTPNILTLFASILPIFCLAWFVRLATRGRSSARIAVFAHQGPRAMHRFYRVAAVVIPSVLVVSLAALPGCGTSPTLSVAGTTGQTDTSPLELLNVS